MLSDSVLQVISTLPTNTFLGIIEHPTIHQTHLELTLLAHYSQYSPQNYTAIVAMMSNSGEELNVNPSTEQLVLV